MVERKHRHIVELGLTLLDQALLPLTYWDHANFLTNVFLIKRLTTPSLNFDIPFVKLYKQQPDFHFLRVFGCAFFPLLRPYNQNKLQFRSKSVFFWDIDLLTKGTSVFQQKAKFTYLRMLCLMSHNFPPLLYLLSLFLNHKHLILYGLINLPHTCNSQSNQSSLYFS